MANCFDKSLWRRHGDSVVKTVDHRRFNEFVRFTPSARVTLICPALMNEVNVLGPDQFHARGFLNFKQHGEMLLSRFHLDRPVADTSRPVFEPRRSWPRLQSHASVLTQVKRRPNFCLNSPEMLPTRMRACLSRAGDLLFRDCWTPDATEPQRRHWGHIELSLRINSTFVTFLSYLHEYPIVTHATMNAHIRAPAIIPVKNPSRSSIITNSPDSVHAPWPLSPSSAQVALVPLALSLLGPALAVRPFSG